MDQSAKIGGGPIVDVKVFYASERRLRDRLNATVRDELEQRRVRRSLFDPTISNETSWSMLLLAFEAFLEDRVLTRDEILAASGVSPDLAKRYLKRLEDRELVLTESAELGWGVYFTELTMAGRAVLMEYVSTMDSLQGLPPEERARSLAELKPVEWPSIFPWRRSPIDHDARFENHT